MTHLLQPLATYEHLTSLLGHQGCLIVNNMISLTKDDLKVGEDRNESINTTQIKSSIALPKLKMSSEFSLS
ncbi:hypothetical protein Tco_1027206 [Tanacetum coccineum]